MEKIIREKKSNKFKMFYTAAALAGKYFIIIIVFATLVILLLGVFFIIKPKYAAIAETIEQKSNKIKADYNSLEEKFAKIKQYKNAYDKISASDKSKIESLLPQKLDYEDLFIRIEAIIKNKGMLLTAMEVNLEKEAPAKSSKENGEKPPEENVKKTPDGLSAPGTIEFKIEVAGVNYMGLKDLLSEFESSIRIMDVEEVGFSQEKNSATLKIKTYYLK